MRSSPSGPDPLDPGPRGFAHRGLHFGSTVPENTLAAFSAALEFGAGIECDLRLTADDQLILFHDADAARLCGNPLRICQSRWADLAGLRVGGHPIPRFESLLALVAGRVPLLLEAKVERDVRRWPTALKLVRLLRREMPGVRRGLLIKQRLSSFERHIRLRIAEADFLGIEESALGMRWVAAARRSMPVYAWTIRTAAERAQAEVQADALIWEGDGRPRN
jgi:glycerophosphoryl diester phosphodiesterase